MYVAIFIDAIVVKVRDGQVANRPVYAAIGVTVDGRKDVLGLWAGTGGEGARFWMNVLTEAGPVQVGVPRDRASSFEPVIVPKRARRLGGIDDIVISLVAKGPTTGEVQAHLAEIYGTEVSRETISTITDRVLDGLAEWQSRPLDAAWSLVVVANPDDEGFACRGTRRTRCRLGSSAAISS